MILSAINNFLNKVDDFLTKPDHEVVQAKIYSSHFFLINTIRIRTGWIFEFNVPGVDKTDFDIDVEGNRLRVSIQQKEDSCETEYSFNSCSRAVSLPRGANFQKISAMYEEGILKVFVPKLENIKIKVE